MSPKIPSLMAGLAAVGLCGFTAAILADPQQTPAPSQLSSPSPTSAVVLLSNGQVLQGRLLETSSGFSLQQKVGTIPLRKNQVEQAFASLGELYQYKAARLPQRDPDEQLKLAQWCLTNHMDAEAKTHLQAALALSPGNPQMKSMLDHLEAAESRKAAVRDTAVVRTSAEVESTDPTAEFSTGLRKRMRGMGVSSVPRIFDLPPAQAVRSALNFNRFVHPVLQDLCAKCHNEQYQGEFQLIQVRTRRDRTLEVYRANLDATLRFVDSEKPENSQLLSITLRPHGNAGKKRAILSGPNDPAYHVLSTWVNGLRPTRPQANLAGVGAANDAGAPGEDFASARGGSGAGVSANSATLAGAATPPAIIPPPEQLPAVRYTPERGMIFESVPSNDDEFPVPYMLGGAKPKVAAPAGANVPAKAQAQTKPGSAALPTVPGANSVPQPARGGEPTLPPLPSADAAKKTPKPVKIDPALLEKALKSRYGAPE